MIVVIEIFELLSQILFLEQLVWEKIMKNIKIQLNNKLFLYLKLIDQNYTKLFKSKLNGRI